MKTQVITIAMFLFMASACNAVPISPFSDTDTYIQRAKGIVVAKCISVPDNLRIDGGYSEMYPATVSILKTLKGERTDHLTVATIYEMTPGKMYLLSSSGGSALNTDFLALAELSVVPLPDGFDLKQLASQSTKAQVMAIFSSRLFQVEKELAPLLRQQQILATAIEERVNEQHRFRGQVRIGAIEQLHTKRRDSSLFLELESGELHWSHIRPGESGYFYFSNQPSDDTKWEFAYVDADDITDLDGKELDVRFGGMFSPMFDKRLIHTGGGIQVSVGQVVLARTEIERDTVYVLKIHHQAEHESMTVLQAVLQNSGK